MSMIFDIAASVLADVLSERMFYLINILCPLSFLLCWFVGELLFMPIYPAFMYVSILYAMVLLIVQIGFTVYKLIDEF